MTRSCGHTLLWRANEDQTLSTNSTDYVKVVVGSQTLPSPVQILQASVQRTITENRTFRRVKASALIKHDSH